MTKELTRLEQIKTLRALEKVSVHGVKPSHHLVDKILIGSLNRLKKLKD
ncbi:hypothetical protein [Alkalihalophilus marmarensis]|nr:hypothetical protein [Alkalihalophilus marmarensis]